MVLCMPKSRRLRTVYSLAIALLLSTAAPGAAQLVPLPADWTVEVQDDYWLAESPREARGVATVIAPLAVPYSGPLQAWFTEVSKTMAGRMFGRFERTISSGYTTLSKAKPLDALYEVIDRDGNRLAVQVYGYDAPPVTAGTGRQAQLIFVIAPISVVRVLSSDPLNRHWKTGLFAAHYLANSTIVLTSELLAAAAGTVGGPVDTPSSEPAPAPAELTAPPIWSARNFADVREGTNQGVALVAPCGDGTPVFSAVFHRYYSMTVDLPGLIVAEARTHTQRWTQGRIVAVGPVRREGDATTTTAAFSTNEGNFIAWFAAAVRDSAYVQRGYVVAPASLANDQRFATARQAVLEIMTQDGRPTLDETGVQPSATGDGVEAVLSLSGLIYATNAGALSSAPVEVALWENGAAAESRSQLNGRWTRIPGGYAIAFQGSYDATIMHVSDSCRTGTATRLTRPAVPRAAASGAAGCRTHRIETGLYPVSQCSPSGSTNCSTVWKNTYNDFSFCD